MTICANPEQKRIRVTVGDSTVILVVRDYTAHEFQIFMGARFKVLKKGKVEDKSTGERIKFMDSILVDIEAVDENGKPETITYVEKQAGKTKPLNKKVEGWVGYVNASWKVSAAIALEGTDAEIEEDVLKN